MGGKVKDLTGQKFGRLSVIKRTGTYVAPSGVKMPIWLCTCECGNSIETIRGSLENGSTKSCGCLRSEIAKMRGSENIDSAREKDMFEKTRVSSLTQKINSRNTSGCIGVTKNKRKDKWQSRLQIQGKKKFLGSFDNLEDAINARKQAEEKYFNPIIEKFKQSKEGI